MPNTLWINHYYNCLVKTKFSNCQKRVRFLRLPRLKRLASRMHQPNVSFSMRFFKVVTDSWKDSANFFITWVFVPWSRISCYSYELYRVLAVDWPEKFYLFAMTPNLQSPCWSGPTNTIQPGYMSIFNSLKVKLAKITGVMTVVQGPIC